MKIAKEGLKITLDSAFQYCASKDSNRSITHFVAALKSSTDRSWSGFDSQVRVPRRVRSKTSAVIAVRGNSAYPAP